MESREGRGAWERGRERAKGQSAEGLVGMQALPPLCSPKGDGRPLGGFRLGKDMVGFVLEMTALSRESLVKDVNHKLQIIRQ